MPKLFMAVRLFSGKAVGAMNQNHIQFRVGDWVEVKRKEEILRTLDKAGRLEGVPFMPQMFQYSGQRFQIYKRAHKTCDTVNPIRSLRIPDAVHLNLRCDGEAYGGCQSGCLIFWKTAWLKPVVKMREGGERSPAHERPEADDVPNSLSCTVADVWAGTRCQDQSANDGPRYVCQATQVPYFGTVLPWWNFRQYLEDYTSHNATLPELLRGGGYALYASAIKAGVGLGAPLRWLYDKIQSILGGTPFPDKTGTIPVGAPTPTEVLNLQPGEIVRVKSHEKILETLNTECKNRGLRFDAEMTMYCGRIHQVRARISKYIDEKTGRLLSLNTAAVILEGAACQGRYSSCRMFCPRSIYAWWREIWLERVADTDKNIAK